ncbi:hypothetical protein GMOD_00004700 [Pyrenophora seminiperda CCB06]|uniref:Uncharacterized protein n=1 Tax=Pyrenophora seminiperda CCB06 TaxID=1302712 RepID=A0A3M7MHI5_9PLEO|nr:hypothetical protein GMOD_00004700 [Pyrenophora seminiperda CCB06]
MAASPNMPPFFLMPALSGVRSRRHLVVIRRAEEHAKDIRELILAARLPAEGLLLLNEEDEEKFHYKLMLVGQASEELTRYVSRRPRSRIMVRVAWLNHGLSQFVGFKNVIDEYKRRWVFVKFHCVFMN